MRRVVSGLVLVLGMTSVIHAEPPGAAIWIEGAIAPGANLDEGAELEIGFVLEIPEEWSASEAGLPQPILQIQVPESVRLEGRYLTEFRQLARNEFLEEPYERAIDPGEMTIPISMLGAPTEGEPIALNVIAYVSSGAETESYFIRRRIELPLEPGATARSAEQASISNWGVNGTLEIGDRAAAYDLPRASGEIAPMSEALGESNLIVTTYRAFW